jgi:hypothetical protein
LQNAFKSYVRARDYCSTPKHIIIMCLNVIKTALEMSNTLHVQNYVAKAEQTPEVAVSAQWKLQLLKLAIIRWTRHHVHLSHHVSSSEEEKAPPGHYEGHTSRSILDGSCSGLCLAGQRCCISSLRCYL